MLTLNSFISQRADQIQTQMQTVIMNQIDEVESAKVSVMNHMLGLSSSRFTIREQFTYLERLKGTLNVMLDMYKEFFGTEFQIPEPEVSEETTTL